MPRLSLLLLACCGLAACSGEAPFIETFPADIRKFTGVAVCHDQDARQDEIDALGAEGCQRLDKNAQRIGTERYQCRLMAPHRTHYKCVDKPKQQ